MNLLARILLVMIAALVGVTAQAQNKPWPTSAVRFVVPFPAGSAPDVLIRHVGVKLTEKWGQSVIVDNKPGGSGVVGMTVLLNGPSDGTTFGFVQGSAISVAPSTIKGVTYDFNRDFLPVTLAAVAPFMLAVPADSPYKTLGEFIAAANQHMAYDGDMGDGMLALFHDLFANRKWWGEDTSFWLRVPPGVQRLALASGITWHAGAPLDLAAWARGYL